MLKIFIGHVSNTQCSTCLTGEVVRRNSPLSYRLFSACQPGSYGTKLEKHFKTQQKGNELNNFAFKKGKTCIPNSITIIFKGKCFNFAHLIIFSHNYTTQWLLRISTT
jgi:hypothetical protein